MSDVMHGPTVFVGDRTRRKTYLIAFLDCSPTTRWTPRTACVYSWWGSPSSDAAMAVHESLAQRIVVRHHLSGLDREELPHYVIHRLRLAGCELPLFEPPAIEAIFQATQGMPRKLNRLAHYALTSAALAKAKSVTCEHVQAALEEITP